jgi:hypothetical protein
MVLHEMMMLSQYDLPLQLIVFIFILASLGDCAWPSLGDSAAMGCHVSWCWLSYIKQNIVK